MDAAMRNLVKQFGKYHLYLIIRVFTGKTVYAHSKTDLVLSWLENASHIFLAGLPPPHSIPAPGSHNIIRVVVKVRELVKLTPFKP